MRLSVITNRRRVDLGAFNPTKDAERVATVLNERWDDLGYAGRFAVIATEENVVWLIGQGG